jgi:uncharacterized protein (TIGR03067 family)
MIRLLPLPVVAALFLAHAPSAPVPEKKDDAEQILGNWVVQSAKEEGKDVADLQKALFTFDKDGRLTLKLPTVADKIELRYSLLTDKPLKGIEIAPPPINDKDKNREREKDRGIYKLEGDTLTLCICDGPGNDPQAPKDFDVKARYVTLVVLQREKK